MEHCEGNKLQDFTGTLFLYGASALISIESGDNLSIRLYLSVPQPRRHPSAKTAVKKPVSQGCTSACDGRYIHAEGFVTTVKFGVLARTRRFTRFSQQGSRRRSPFIMKPLSTFKVAPILPDALQSL